jgi:DNA-binding NarL/FixJ family response regulator
MSRDRVSTAVQTIDIDQSDNTFVENKQPVNAERSGAEVEGRLAVIDSRKFLRECIRHSVQSAFPMRVDTYSPVLEFENKLPSASICLIIVSLSEVSLQAAADVLQTLADLAPGVPVVVLSYEGGLDLARAVIASGARGYIPVTMGFEIAIEAVRFVLAGGTYVPADFFLAPTSSEFALQPHRSASDAVTTRELAVVRRIQQSKPNKVIAAELRISEGTVKIHVRHIMKKLAAKNRTEVAIKSARMLAHEGATHGER